MFCSSLDTLAATASNLENNPRISNVISVGYDTSDGGANKPSGGPGGTSSSSGSGMCIVSGVKGNASTQLAQVNLQIGSLTDTYAIASTSIKTCTSLTSSSQATGCSSVDNPTSALVVGSSMEWTCKGVAEISVSSI